MFDAAPEHLPLAHTGPEIFGVLMGLQYIVRETERAFFGGNPISQAVKGAKVFSIIGSE